MDKHSANFLLAFAYNVSNPVSLVLKNSFGVDDVELGLNFIGECGYFKELKKASEMNASDYIQATYISDKDRLLISQQPKFKVN